MHLSLPTKRAKLKKKEINVLNLGSAAGSLMCFYKREKLGKYELQLCEKEDVFN